MYALVVFILTFITSLAHMIDSEVDTATKRRSAAATTSIVSSSASNPVSAAQLRCARRRHARRAARAHVRALPGRGHGRRRDVEPDRLRRALRCRGAARSSRTAAPTDRPSGLGGGAAGPEPRDRRPGLPAERRRPGRLRGRARHADHASRIPTRAARASLTVAATAPDRLLHRERRLLRRRGRTHAASAIRSRSTGSTSPCAPGADADAFAADVQGDVPRATAPRPSRSRRSWTRASR